MFYFSFTKHKVRNLLNPISLPFQYTLPWILVISILNFVSRKIPVDGRFFPILCSLLLHLFMLNWCDSVDHQFVLLVRRRRRKRRASTILKKHMDTSIIEKMLSSPASLLRICLHRGTFNLADQVIKIFSLNDADWLKEIMFGESFQVCFLF